MVKTALSTVWRNVSVARVFFFAVAAVAMSCGGMRGGAGPDAGDAGGDARVRGGVDSDFDSGLACQQSSSAAEPEVPTFVIPDGGVPLDQVAFALAVARCNYWSRCAPLAPYVVSQCIQAVSQSGSWHFTTCSDRSAGNWQDRQCFTITVEFPLPSAATFQAVREGLVRYDPEQEGACLRQLQAQSCHGSDLWDNIPACAATFTCSPDAEADDGGSSAGVAVDGGTACAAVLEPWVTTPGETLLPCAGASDCSEAAWPGGPYCVDGYCAPGPLGDSDYCQPADGGVCDFVDSGQPCDSDPPFLGEMSATPWGAWPTKICSPGLTCSGLTSSGELGVCSAAQDIGGPCTQSAAITGCRIGLSCPCGTCQISPSRGPCASDSCQIGVAYCDLKSNTCVPVKQIGGDCTDGPQACPPDLECDSTSTCRPYSPQ